jgi:hypothetical protein
MHRNSFGVTAAGLVLSTLLATSAALAEDFRGHVTKQGTRLARPQGEALQAELSSRQPATAPLTGGVHDHSFVLKSDVLAPTVSTQGWNPFGNALSHPRPAPTSFQANATHTQAPAIAAVEPDYNAIERAYAESVPPAPAPRLASGTSSGGIPVDLAHTAYAGQVIAQGGVATGTAGAPGCNMGGPPRIVVDTCLCEQMVPTGSCTMSRTAGWGTNLAPGGATPAVAPRVGVSAFGNVARPVVAPPARIPAMFRCLGR